MSRKGAGIVASGRAPGINLVSAESYRVVSPTGIAKYFYTPVTSIETETFNVPKRRVSSDLSVGIPCPEPSEGPADPPGLE